ncbi:MAG: hypothetical protein HY956_04215 [Deltaproteobacteria bacterium]|nr:hypothetical protein [Deltaproteobacteria bacterium]
MQRILKMLGVFSTASIVLASFGLILATSSFISGLQLVKSASIVERKIHRFNGFTALTIYVILAILAFWYEGFGFLRLLGWVSGLCVFLLKILIVRSKKRRAFKYLSWLGGTLILVWLYMVYIHIPV